MACKRGILLLAGGLMILCLSGWSGMHTHDWTEQLQIVHHDTEGHFAWVDGQAKWVVDQAAWDETFYQGKRCEGCGAIQTD